MESIRKYFSKNMQACEGMKHAPNQRRRTKWFWASRKWAAKYNAMQRITRVPDPRCGYPEGFLYPETQPVRACSDRLAK
jgi:hypothetical protein